MKKMKKIKYNTVILIFLGILIIGFLIINPSKNNISNVDYTNVKVNSVEYLNATVISDGYNDIYWNDGLSECP